MIQPIDTQYHVHHNHYVPTVLEGYVFETPISLTQGNWKVVIEKGDGWVFSDRGNFPVKSGETILLNPNDGAIQIRRLYVKGPVKFTATRL